MANYVLQWFPAFFLGAVYGKLMDMTGSARSLADAIVRLIGPKFAVAAVVIPCLLMTYGGISLFVVVFVIYPMGYAIYRAADLPLSLIHIFSHPVGCAVRLPLYRMDAVDRLQLDDGHRRCV